MKKIISSSIGILLLLSPVVASADVASQIAALQALIQQLLVQIAQLKAQQGGGGSTVGGFCYTFNTDLQFGDVTSERDGSGDTRYLHQALQKEGFTIDESDSNGRWIIRFGDSTRAAVIKFQAKYGIRQTGYVGPLTRAQLNRLYGCKNAQTNSGAFSATPISGAAPLTVTFTHFQRPSDWPATYSGTTHQLKLDYGDGQVGFEIPGECHACSDSHVYQNPGTYAAKLLKFSNYPNDETFVGSVTITVTGTSQSNISVPGMSRYTDADFGFTFWYPSGWKLEELPNTNFATSYQGGTVKRRWQMWSAIDNDHSMNIEEYYSPSASITINAESGCPGGQCSVTFRYYFDSTTHTWMYETPFGRIAERGTHDYAPHETGAADVSHNTMGGLHIFPGGFKGASMIIPLSAHNFVVVSDMPWNVGPAFKSYLVNTIVAQDPAVATPVSVAEQTKTIQAEQSAYLSIISHAPIGQ